MSTPFIMTDSAIDPPDPELRVSERFRNANADVVFQAIDGTLFHIHRKNLETQAGGFPPAGFSTLGDIVMLSEQSETLELLFQFVYPARHPYLDSVSFETLALLAEAAEKYQVYSAMNICRIRMTHTLPEHGEDIMDYAVKHDYPDIMALAAPLLLNKSLEDIVLKLPPRLTIPWVCYHEGWSKCVQRAIISRTVVNELGLTTNAYHNYSTLTDTYICSSCSRSSEVLISKVLNELLKGVISLKNLDDTFSSSFTCCDRMKPALVAWRSAVAKDVQNIPTFTSFL